jgi:hypothetical protein
MSDRSIPDVTFSYADHQYLNRLMNVRDMAITDYVLEKVAEHNKPFYELMEKFDNRLKVVEFKTSWWMALIFSICITIVSASIAVIVVLVLHNKFPLQ